MEVLEGRLLRKALTKALKVAKKRKTGCLRRLLVTFPTCCKWTGMQVGGRILQSLQILVIHDLVKKLRLECDAGCTTCPK